MATTVSSMAYSSFVRAAVIPIVGKIVLRRGYYAKLTRDADDIAGDSHLERLLVGKGILRNHTGTNPLSGVALCGMPVSSWTGGGLADVECHLCRDALHAAGRRRSMRHHPAGRKRRAAAATASLSTWPDPRGRCDD